MTSRNVQQLALLILIVCALLISARGLEVFLGVWTLPVIVASILLRFGLTFVVGAFFYALFILNWQTSFSALFALPALLLMFPNMWPDVARAVAWWRND